MGGKPKAKQSLKTHDNTFSGHAAIPYTCHTGLHNNLASCINMHPSRCSHITNRTA